MMLNIIRHFKKGFVVVYGIHRPGCECYRNENKRKSLDLFQFVGVAIFTNSTKTIGLFAFFFNRYLTLLSGLVDTLEFTQQVSTEYCKTETKVLTPAYHKTCRQSNEPVKTPSTEY